MDSTTSAPSLGPRKSIVLLVRASRPMGWIFAPMLYAAGVIHSGAIPTSQMMIAVCLPQIMTLTFPLCLVAFGVNDAYDYYSDLVNPRKSDTSVEGIILAPAHRNLVLHSAAFASAVIICVSFLPSYFSSEVTTDRLSYMPAISTTLLVACFWIYSAPPLRLKERPFLDSLSNGVIIWLGWFVGFVSCSTLVGKTRSVQDAPLEMYMLSLAACSVHALIAAADIEADVSAGYKTIATVLGRRGTSILGTVIYGLAVSTSSFPSVFGFYFVGGLCVMVTACIHPTPNWVHRGFVIIFFWTTIMASIWLFMRLKELRIM